MAMPEIVLEILAFVVNSDDDDDDDNNNNNNNNNNLYRFFPQTPLNVFRQKIF